jgi:hypothetical protein
MKCFYRIFSAFGGLLVLLDLTITSYAQYVDFGRNKVQYTNFDWHTLTTQHFKIYYYPEMQELAEIGAAYAEESYKQHQQDFNYSLIDTVPLIFYATPTHFRESNTTPGLIPDAVGGFTEFIKGRVVIPYDGSLGSFKHVIRHELTHVFMMAKIGNVLRLHRLSMDNQPPLWFTEGLAEAWSSEWDETAEMVIKDAVLNGYMTGLRDWEYFYGTFFMYKMGQNAINFIQDKYGHEKVLELMDNFWMSNSFSTVMQKTLGVDYEGFDKEWLYSLKKKYFPTLTTEDNPSQKTEKIFADGFGYKPAYYRKFDKEFIFFIGNRTGYTSIFKVDMNDLKKKPELVLEGERTDEFESFHFFRSGIGISSKGILAFATKSGENDALHFYDIESERMLDDYHFKNIVQIGSPSFSPDGNKVTFEALDIGGKADIYIFDITGKKLTRLTNDYYDDRDPDFSPDGKTIVFSSDRTAYGLNNRYNLFLYRLDNNSISYLTSGNRVDYSPQFSKDGKKIIYTSAEGGSQNIRYLDFSSMFSDVGSHPFGTGSDTVSYKLLKSIKLTSFTTAAFDPKWAGDDSIVFAAYEEGGIHIRMLNNVSALVDSAKISEPVVYNKTHEFWAADKIKGNLEKNELRYQKEYSLDVATSSISTDPVFGTNAGGILAMSDMLGNDQYYFLVFNNAQTGEEFFKSFNIAITRVSLASRPNYAYGIFHLSGNRYNYGDDFAYYERTFGGYFALSYPLSFFSRIDASVSLANSFRDITETSINRRAMLMTNSLSYTHDNSLWGPTGPLDGDRFNVTLAYTNDIQYSNVNYFTFIFDARKYLRLSRMVALAGHAEYLVNSGEEARRWVIGGSWDLRGYDRFSIRGTNVVLGSLELRFPLIDLFAVHFPLGIDFDFPYIRGAAFFDVGNAWDNQYGQTLGSLGLGARMNLFNIFALRYDVGKRIENNFKHFQHGWFTQFFFGWDF